MLCLTPVAVYLSWLGSINRRPRPTVISGAWDFVFLLGGLAGFVLFGGGIILSVLQSNIRLIGRGNWEQIKAVWGQEHLEWAAVTLAYILIVAAVVAVVVLLRAATLSVYNIGRDDLENAVDEALAQAGIPGVRTGNVWAADYRVVAIDWFAGFRHATVRILTPHPRDAEEIERGLRKRLAATPAADGPVASWLRSAATICLAAVACSLFLVFYFLYLNR
ncbi:hypothetical protein FRUB_07907 [Fimbriiglobus ruber]|uniref:Uncharacterized protein n=1 Tax=Fimbriiglobus ruber TaxID=1908690 RepID=A0A225DKP7_9BACT|nr:hypothetical protein FRUB_07907 [Fimbriiglobus ruber]